MKKRTELKSAPFKKWRVHPQLEHGGNPQDDRAFFCLDGLQGLLYLEIAGQDDAPASIVQRHEEDEQAS